jgi:hypothetical protein
MAIAPHRCCGSTQTTSDLVAQLGPKLPGSISVTEKLGCPHSTAKRTPPPRREFQGCSELAQRLARTLQIEQQFTELFTGWDDWARRDWQFLDRILLICCRTQAENGWSS